MKNLKDSVIHLSLSPIVPKDPGIYAMYDKANKVAYVGRSKNLRERIQQHIIKRDSSVSTGVSATVLNPDKISHIEWWVHEDFSNEDYLKAAEHIAFEVLNPVLRSRENVSEKAKTILKDQNFCKKMKDLFNNRPSVFFHPNSLDNLGNLVNNLVNVVEKLNERVSALESQNKSKQGKGE